MIRAAPAVGKLRRLEAAQLHVLLHSLRNAARQLIGDFHIEHRAAAIDRHIGIGHGVLICGPAKLRGPGQDILLAPRDGLLLVISQRAPHPQIRLRIAPVRLLQHIAVARGVSAVQSICVQHQDAVLFFRQGMAVHIVLQHIHQRKERHLIPAELLRSVNISPEIAVDETGEEGLRVRHQLSGAGDTLLDTPRPAAQGLHHLPAGHIAGVSSRRTRLLRHPQHPVISGGVDIQHVAAAGVKDDIGALQLRLCCILDGMRDPLVILDKAVKILRHAAGIVDPLDLHGDRPLHGGQQVLMGAVGILSHDLLPRRKIALHELSPQHNGIVQLLQQLRLALQRPAIQRGDTLAIVAGQHRQHHPIPRLY